MERDNDTNDLVELGAVSAETQGVNGQGIDLQIQLPVGGLSDD
jgi:hypothetical protein